MPARSHPWPQATRRVAKGSHTQGEYTASQRLIPWPAAPNQRRACVGPSTLGPRCKTCRAAGATLSAAGPVALVPSLPIAVGHSSERAPKGCVLVGAQLACDGGDKSQLDGETVDG